MPDSLADAELILTPCDAKNSSAEQAKLTAVQNLTLYVGVDSRLDHVPSWLSGFTKNGDTVSTTNEVIFDIYTKTMRAGETVSLGANGQASNCMNYIVLAAADNSVLIGDVNLDGSITAADAYALTKYLLTETSLTAEQGAMADLSGDGKLNAADLTLLKKLILK